MHFRLRTHSVRSSPSLQPVECTDGYALNLSATMVALSRKLFQLDRLAEIVRDLDPAFFHDPNCPLQWGKV